MSSLFERSKMYFCQGFMTCTMFLSMWISNTATMAVMVPIVDSINRAVLDDEDDEKGARSKEQNTRRNMMLLSCAYAANVGGSGIITGVLTSKIS